LNCKIVWELWLTQCPVSAQGGADLNGIKMLSLLVCIISSVSFTPELTACPGYINLNYGEYTYQTDQAGWWRRSFTAQEAGKLTIERLDFNQPDFFTQVSKYDSFTLRVNSQPYDEFTLKFEHMPEPCTVSFLIMGGFLFRKYGNSRKVR
jgi:hypothetical protein